MSKDQAYKKQYFEASRFYVSYGIEKLDEIIYNLDNDKIDLSDINSVMELRNVAKVLDSDIYSDKIELEEYKKYSSKINRIFDNYLNNLTPDKLFYDLENVVMEYKIDFIEQIITRKIYEKVDKNDSNKFLDALNCYPRVYLKFKNFVDYFDNEIKNRILSTNLFAEIYIDEKYSADKSKKIYFPQLNENDISNALDRYVNGSTSDVHYLGKILYIRDFKRYEFIRFTASEKRNKILNEMSKSAVIQGTTIEIRAGLENSNKILQNKTILTYDIESLKGSLDCLSLLNNFIYLFDFVDCHTMLCNLVYKSCHDGVLEKVMDVRGDDMYFENYHFKKTETISYLQLVFYIEFLSKSNISINKIIKWFFTQYICENFGVEGFKISLSDEHSSYYAKCKDLSTIFDEISRQYYLWVKYKRLDDELIKITTKPIRFENIPSMSSEHYYYNESFEVEKEINMLFNNQLGLHYVEKYKDNHYNSLYELLIKENVSLDDFYPYQREAIEWLLSRKTIQSVNAIIKINFSKTILLKMLYEDNVIALTKFNKEMVFEIFKNEEHRIESALLSNAEVDYFDYYLNDRYMNGQHIRNKYSHLPPVDDEETCKQDYYFMIRLVIILIIKIKDDLCTYYDKGCNN